MYTKLYGELVGFCALVWGEDAVETHIRPVRNDKVAPLRAVRVWRDGITILKEMCRKKGVPVIMACNEVGASLKDFEQFTRLLGFTEPRSFAFLEV